ncbi:MAG: hypothetical protein DRO73_11260 [Candidatus Thorarchaeota archaeon]|nr:MAG: hypothetical protein DRO73_11260 [Candidatus Thorarchaeota archaeon]
MVEDSLRQATELFTWAFAGICSALAVPGLSAAVYVQTIVGALCLWSVWFASVVSVCQLGIVTVDFLCGLVGMWLHSLFGKAMIALAGTIWLSYLLMKYKVLSETMGWKWVAARLVWSIVSIAFQFLVAVATLHLFANLVETSMQAHLMEA